MEYTILQAKLCSDLENNVNDYIKMGWKPVGGGWFNENTKYNCQAMMK